MWSLEGQNMVTGERGRFLLRVLDIGVSETNRPEVFVETARVKMGGQVVEVNVPILRLIGSLQKQGRVRLREL